MDITAAIAAGSANPFLLFAMALVLGALHGLEPGHSKTMMAAYIIAIRGTVFQAVLLGISAATSHVAIVWVLAILGLRYGNELIGDDLEPVFIAISGAIIVGVGMWVLWQAVREKEAAANGRTHHHDGHDHLHAHDHEHEHSHEHAAAHAHAFHHDTAHVGHAHSHAHGNEHGHGHSHPHEHAHDHSHMDAHALAHARDIEARLKSGRTSTLQTILFGLSGGLIPCPAAITVLLLCLQLKKMALGLTLVTAFSVGLAVTLVVVGVVAALGIKYAAHRSRWLDSALQHAPFVSAILICVLGLVMIFTSFSHSHA